MLKNGGMIVVTKSRKEVVKHLLATRFLDNFLTFKLMYKHRDQVRLRLSVQTSKITGAIAFSYHCPRTPSETLEAHLIDGHLLRYSGGDDLLYRRLFKMN